MLYRSVPEPVAVFDRPGAAVWFATDPPAFGPPLIAEPRHRIRMSGGSVGEMRRLVVASGFAAVLMIGGVAVVYGLRVSVPAAPIEPPAVTLVIERLTVSVPEPQEAPPVPAAVAPPAVAADLPEEPEAPAAAGDLPKEPELPAAAEDLPKEPELPAVASPGARPARPPPEQIPRRPTALPTRKAPPPPGVIRRIAPAPSPRALAVPQSASSPSAGPAPPAPVQPAQPGAGAMAAFQAALRGAVRAALVYPPAARMAGQHGSVRVAFDYADGRASNVSLAAASGMPLLDRAAVTTVQSAHYPPPPPEMAQRTLHLSIMVEFEPHLAD
jgi:protein TonB